MDRRCYRVDGTMREDVNISDTVRVESGHRAPRRGPEADDGGPQPPAIRARHSGQLEGMEHRTVTGHLIVLVKDMQAERAVGRPVVHRLERDQGEPAVDAELGDLLVLNAMRPAPQHLSRSHVCEVGGLRLGEQDDIAVLEKLGTRAEPGDALRELLVRDYEGLSVTGLEVDVFPQVSGDPLEVQRMNREPALALFPRPAYDTEAELIHARSLAWNYVAHPRSRSPAQPPRTAAPSRQVRPDRPSPGPVNCPTLRVRATARPS